MLKWGGGIGGKEREGKSAVKKLINNYLKISHLIKNIIIKILYSYSKKNEMRERLN